MSDSQVLRNQARMGVSKIVSKMGGNAALQNTASNLADKALVAGAGALMKNKGKILGKMKKLIGFQRGGVIVIRASTAKKPKGRKRGKKSKK